MVDGDGQCSMMLMVYVDDLFCWRMLMSCIDGACWCCLVSMVNVDH